MITASTTSVIVILAIAQSATANFFAHSIFGYDNDDNIDTENLMFDSCTATNRKYKCFNGECIDLQNVCNGVPDCSDGTDEVHYCRYLRCTPGKFKCKYGACIDYDLVCNGQLNCADRSDEDPKLCTGFFEKIVFPKPKRIEGETQTPADERPATRKEGCQVPKQPENGEWTLEEDQCSTGAKCALPTATFVYPGTKLIYECNHGYKLNANPNVYCTQTGRWSKPPKCKSTSQYGSEVVAHRNPPSKTCSVYDGKVRCDDGQCIEVDLLCNGVYDCSDKSDETAFHCDVIYCGANEFQCKYGYCIDKKLKCNGAVDCLDGSDEDSGLCRNNVPTAKPPATKEGCKAPEQAKNGNWQLENDRSSHSHNNEGSLATYLPPGTQLHYRCNKGYKLNAASIASCGLDGSWFNVPKCEEILCEPLDGVSREAHYTLDGNNVSNRGSLKPGTIAKLEYRNGYNKPYAKQSTRLDTVVCNEQGKWESKPVIRLPECGKLQPVAQLTNGSTISFRQASLTEKPAEFPWHATLYMEIDQEIKPVCAATVITDKLLITAAHCVYNVNLRKDYEPSMFFVATGNVHSDYNHSKHTSLVKKFEVKKIYINPANKNGDDKYGSDIAMLEIATPFVFSDTIMPVCLDITPQSYQAVLKHGIISREASFELTDTGDAGPILRSSNASYVSEIQCIDVAIKTGFSSVLGSDNICALYQNGSHACVGDYGSGLVFETGNKWYLRGILSSGLQEIDNGSCYQYGLYTKVLQYINWIQTVIMSGEEKSVQAS